MGKALSHLANTSRSGDKHTISGLIDLDTGEVLIEGMNARAAVLQGYVEGHNNSRQKQKAREGEGGRTPRLDRTKQKQLLAKATGVKIGGTSFVYPGSAEPPQNRVPTPIRTVLEGWNLVLPPHIFGLFSVVREILVDDRGHEYNWDPEGFSNFVWDCVVHYIEWIMPPLLAEASGGRMSENGALRVLRRIAAMAPEDVMSAAEEAARAAEQEVGVGASR